MNVKWMHMNKSMAASCMWCLPVLNLDNIIDQWWNKKLRAIVIRNRSTSLTDQEQQGTSNTNNCIKQLWTARYNTNLKQINNPNRSRSQQIKNSKVQVTLIGAWSSYNKYETLTDHEQQRTRNPNRLKKHHKKEDWGSISPWLGVKTTERRQI